MTRFSTVAAWAASTGSKAKTLRGQRAAIIASFRPIGGFALIGNMRGFNVLRSKTPIASPAMRQRQRQIAFAESHPLVRNSPRPATKKDVGGTGPYYVSARAAINDPHALRHYSNYYTTVAGWTVRLEETVSYDRDRYSKAWHAQYGAAKVVESRTVIIRRVAADGTLERRDVQVDAWRGNFLLNALVSAGVLPNNKGLMSVRLHAGYEIELIRAGKTIKVYRRTLAGNPVDFCVVWHGITFHDATVRDAIRGLRSKLRAAIEAKASMITWKLGKSLGFCEPGMRQFAADFGLDVNGAYSPDEIERRVRGNMADAAKYASELRALAAAVNHPIPTDLQ